MTTNAKTTHAGGEQQSRRMTLSQVVERLLDRGGSAHSSIELGLTAGQKVTIGVSIRTSDDGEATTIADAEELAQAVFDRLRLKYAPAPDDEAGDAGTSSCTPPNGRTGSRCRRRSGSCRRRSPTLN